MRASVVLLLLCVAPRALDALVAPLRFGALPAAGRTPALPPHARVIRRLEPRRWRAGAVAGKRARGRSFLAGGAHGAGLSSLAARDGDDELGDITRLLADEPLFAAGERGNSRMFPSTSPVASETDIIMGSGVGQSEQLQDAIDAAVAAAMVNWPLSAEGQPKVPSLAIMFFYSQYAQQGLGRVLPCLLRTFATTGGKPWKVGVSVVGCTAEGFDLEDDSTPVVSVTLIHGNLLTVLPFCGGDEAAAWSEADWSYKGGLKGLYDDPSTSLLLLGHPSSLPATSAALQQLHSAYPASNKLGGIAGGDPSSDSQDRCVIFRKGTGVFNKRGQLIFGEDKDAAKYSTIDDLFFDGGTWRRSGFVGAAISGLTLDNVCIGDGGEDVKAGLARIAANKSIKKVLVCCLRVSAHGSRGGPIYMDERVQKTYADATHARATSTSVSSLLSLPPSLLSPSLILLSPPTHPISLPVSLPCSLSLHRTHKHRHTPTLAHMPCKRERVLVWIFMHVYIDYIDTDIR